MSSELPSGIVAVVEDLTARGYAVSMDREDRAAFGNRVIEFKASPDDHDKPNVRLVKDRGLWSMDIEFDAQWHDLFRLSLAVDSTSYQRRALSHDDRRQLAAHVLDTLPHSNPTEIRHRLDEYKAAALRELRLRSTDA